MPTSATFSDHEPEADVFGGVGEILVGFPGMGWRCFPESGLEVLFGTYPGPSP